MMEAEWLTATEPWGMLHHYPPLIASDRKERLFACSCTRLLWSSHTEEDRRAIDAGERFADELITSEERNIARTAGFEDIPSGRLPAPSRAARTTANTAGSSAAEVTATHAADAGVDWQTLALILRDIFGNPFCPVTIAPSWFTPTVVALADAIYADRAFDRMPILADALEEVGCDHPDVLAHCRGDGPHARRCWVVDLVMGKNCADTPLKSSEPAACTFIHYVCTSLTAGRSS